MGVTKRPYGLWESPITAESLAKGGGGGLVIEPNFAIVGDTIYFVERRPGLASEILVALSLTDGSEKDVTLEAHGVRSGVHEYGGLAWCVSEEGVAFVQAKSQAVTLYDGSGYRELFSHEAGRFGDLFYDETRRRYLAVGEFHEQGEVRNELWFIGEGGGGHCAMRGADFYASPRVSGDGKRCAWLQWNHPLMAWDGAELWLADIGDDGELANPRHIRGGARDGKMESCFQPEYDGKGNLYFICDNDDGFWQLHCLGSDGEIRAFPLRGGEGEGWVECGLPLWQLGMRTYDVTDDGVLLTGADNNNLSRGVWGLYQLSEGKKGEGWRKLGTDYCFYEGLRVSGGKGYFLASHRDGAPMLVELDLASGESRVLRRSGGDDIDVGYISHGRSIEFDSEGVSVQGYFYPPTNKDYEGAEGELPPVIMRCHGGPTASVHNGFAGKVQFWTSRGFAVCDLNYRGSTGFGRDYRESLYGKWGVAEVQDYLSAARYLVDEGLVDGERLMISGSSAGGFTVLCVLAFGDGFSAGCSAYGIGDLGLLAADTHKFESHYLDSLVGSGGSGGRTEGRVEDLYRERSPYYSADAIACPVLFLQGSEDKVVPPNQMYSMVEVLRSGGVWCEYILFDGEGHGFRDGDNIVRAYEGELDFYVRVLNLPC